MKQELKSFMKERSPDVLMGIAPVDDFSRTGDGGASSDACSYGKVLPHVLCRQPCFSAPRFS